LGVRAGYPFPLFSLKRSSTSIYNAKKMTLTHGSLFSGIGGFDLAAEWMGWDNTFHCEWNESASTILKQHWPNAISYHDITTTDFTVHRGAVDVITGGFPCQPFSMAGKRKGQEDDRYLWPEMLRAITEIAPRYVVAENVYGLLNIDRGHTVEVVCSDLESIGYEKPLIFDCTSDSFGLSTMERHIWIITTATDKRCERSLQGANQNQRDTERQFQRSHSGADKRWDISETEFQRVGERVSDKLDKADKQRLIQMGNAIPPQVAYQIFKAINEMERVRDGGTVGAPTE
jgi:DNA-cytosine methyltransferase